MRRKVPGDDPAQREASEIRRGVQIGDVCLQCRSRDVAGRRDVPQDGGKQRGEIGTVGHLAIGRGGQRRATGLGRGIDHWEVESICVVVVQQVQEEFIGFLHYLGDAGIVTIDLVHHQNDRQLLCQGLAEHEASLGKRALRGVHKQQYPVDHLQAALNLATEVRVTGRVNDVDGDSRTIRQPVPYGGVLGEDGDAFFPLQVHRVQHPFLDSLTGTKRPGLPEHRVDQRRLAVVDVRDDRYVPQIRTDGQTETLSPGLGQPGESMADGPNGPSCWPLAHRAGRLATSPLLAKRVSCAE